jgi:haloalkane dehalogenase
VAELTGLELFGAKGKRKTDYAVLLRTAFFQKLPNNPAFRLRKFEKALQDSLLEAIPIPLTWSEFPEIVRDVFRGFRSPAGEDMVLRDNMFVEQLLPGGVIRSLTDVEMANYRKPFLNPGEDRRPTLTWPRQIPLDGEPVEVVKVVTEFGNWLRQSQVPKLWIHGDPGAIETAKVRSFCRTWPNQTEVTVKGVHFLQEDSPTEIGAAVADFVRRLRID